MKRTARFSRGAAQRLIVVVTAAVIVVLVSACGSSSGSRSDANPAAIVPASVPLYISAAVPTDAQVSQFHQLVTEFAGAKAWTKISHKFNALLAKKKVNWKRDVEPWIGSHVGVAVMDLADLSAGSGKSDKGLVLILPTSNMKAALAYAKKTATGGMVAERDGTYLIFGDRSTLAEFTAATGAKLSSGTGYTAVEKAVSGDNVVVYGAVHTIADQILAASASAKSAAAKAIPPATVTQALAKIPADATVGLGVSLSKRAARIDVIPHGLPTSAAGTTGGAGTVAGLPASSILAAALNFTLPKNASLVKALTGGFSHGLTQGAVSGIPGAGQIKHVESIADTVLPALGPLTLSVGGTALNNLQAGLTLTPSSATAADKLVGLIFNLVKSKPAIQVRGNAQDFSLGAGPFNLKVANQAGKVLALLGYANANALLHPASTLASNPMFKRAISQLPSGAKVPFYLSFKGLKTLLAAIPASNLGMARNVLGKLNYLVIGSAPGDFRIVLGLG